MSRDDSLTVVRLHGTVTGRVQGVGYRAFVVSHAERLGITGWVRNGPDGRTVEVVAEGAEESLRLFSRALRQGPSGAYVTDVHETIQTAPRSFESFSVRY